jgi:hypothetical protein
MSENRLNIYKFIYKNKRIRVYIQSQLFALLKNKIFLM